MALIKVRVCLGGRGGEQVKFHTKMLFLLLTNKSHEVTEVAKNAIHMYIHSLFQGQGGRQLTLPLLVSFLQLNHWD